MSWKEILETKHPLPGCLRQTHLFQSLESFPDRRLADFEFLREVSFVESLSWLQKTTDNFPLQIFIAADFLFLTLFIRYHGGQLGKIF